MKNKKEIIEFIFILLALALLLLNKPSLIISLLVLSILGFVGALGATIINLSFPEINRFIKYFINTVWLGFFILLSICYFVFTNIRFSILGVADKLVFSGFISLIVTLLTFPFEYIFFSMAFIFLVNIRLRK